MSTPPHHPAGPHEDPERAPDGYAHLPGPPPTAPVTGPNPYANADTPPPATPAPATPYGPPPVPGPRPGTPNTPGPYPGPPSAPGAAAGAPPVPGPPHAPAPAAGVPPVPGPPHAPAPAAGVPLPPTVPAPPVPSWSGPLVPPPAVTPPPVPVAARHRRPTALLAAAIVGLLVFGAGTWYAAVNGAGAPVPAKGAAAPSAPAAPPPSAAPGPDDAKGLVPVDTYNARRGPGEAELLWSRQNTIALPGAGGNSEGQWLVGDTLVKTLHDQVTAYALADGAVRWRHKLPNTLCGLTQQTTADHKIVVAYKTGTTEDAVCDQIRSLDLTNGTVGWTRKLVQEHKFDMPEGRLPLSITGDLVTVNRAIVVSAYKVSTGEKAWSHLEQKPCTPYKYAAQGTSLVAAGLCTQDKMEIQGIDPATGNVTWRFAPKSGDYVIDQVYAVNPTIVDFRSNATGNRGVGVYDANGKERSQLRSDGAFGPACKYGTDDESLQTCRGVVLDRASDTLFMPGKDSDAATVTESFVFDLATGAVKRRLKHPSGRDLEPLRVIDGKLYAYLKPSKTEPGELVTVPVDGDTFTTVLKNPKSTVDLERRIIDPVVTTDGRRLIVGAASLLGEQAAEEKENLVMVFGP
ncbi:PQQ-binding-like beta-propeller repeat protein [Streptomyces sp. BI20]|uniref:outer membrane protein assembly factor BamB family protein n=1 Tax=Streptomyces sp. BI20 TaxID=3403460 RepID=UPI003C76EADF